MKTVSKSRHVAIVEIDLDYDDDDVDIMNSREDVVNEVRMGLIADDDVVLVEEDFLMYKYYDAVGLAGEDLVLNLGRSDDYDELLPSSGRISNGANVIDTDEEERRRERRLVEFQQYGIQITQVSEVWRLINAHPNKYINTPIKICVIDTGYDMTHEDLPKSNITTTNTGYGDPLTDIDGHGTHVAGVIGAVGNNGLGIVGVNPNPTKFAFHISKALNDDGLGTASSVLVGIEGCISSGSKIISMSLGGGPSSSEIFREIYEDAYNQGVLPFAASGNLGLYIDDYPASYPTVVSVGAVGMDSRRANFSNWNMQLELMGPGVDIVSTYPGDRYGALSGTSMAVPCVAGIAALIWGYFPQCSNQQIRNVLAVTAKAMTSRRICNHKIGYGLVQAKDAFDLLDKYGCDAGGQNYNPPSAGGMGGCSQQITHMQQKTDRDSAADRCQQLTLRLLTDNYAYETSWQLIDSRNKVLDVGPNGEGKLKRNTQYSGPVGGCLEPGTYNFTIRGELVFFRIFHIMLIDNSLIPCVDKFGDGLDEPGYYTITLNDIVF
jgi:serine protease